MLSWKINGSTQAQELVRKAYFLPKASQSRYEREWRDISERSGLGDGAFRITAIHLGMRCPSAVVQAISAMLQDRSDIAIFEIYPRGSSFTLARRRVDIGEILSYGLRLSPTIEFKDVFPAEDDDRPEQPSARER